MRLTEANGTLFETQLSIRQTVYIRTRRLVNLRTIRNVPSSKMILFDDHVANNREMNKSRRFVGFGGDRSGNVEEIYRDRKEKIN